MKIQPTPESPTAKQKDKWRATKIEKSTLIWPQEAWLLVMGVPPAQAGCGQAACLHLICKLNGQPDDAQGAHLPDLAY